VIHAPAARWPEVPFACFGQLPRVQFMRGGIEEPGGGSGVPGRSARYQRDVCHLGLHLWFAPEAGGTR